MAGAGAAGTAVLRLLIASGATDVVVCDDKGAVYTGRPGLDDSLRWIAEHTNPTGYSGDLRGALSGRDALLGETAPHILERYAIPTMNTQAILSARATP